MYLNRPDQPPRTRLNIRIAILTGVAVALFSVVFLRLWYLQVLSGDRYLERANDNRVHEVRVQPPRGDIVDRNGKILVDNRGEMALEVNAGELPRPGPRRKRVFSALEGVTGIPPAKIRRLLREGDADFPGGPVTLRQGVGRLKVLYLLENRARFPGVSVKRIFTRDYRQGTLAAHLFGNVGEVTAEQLDQPRYQGLEQGDLVGQSGIEYEYDRFLRGKPGATRINVDALGRTRGQLASQPASAGDNVRLTIDSELQAVGEEALGSFGLPGAFVAMDPNNGEILAMGSTPTFDPDIFTRPITERQYKALASRRSDAPLANRAIQGLYPTGSAFKPITATAALEEELIAADEIVNDTGLLKVDILELKNAGDAVFGPINMSDALKVSSDIYFYKLGLEAPAQKGHGAIQDWARKFGLGEPTGIDIPAELPGLVPTPAWRNRLFNQREELNCDLCPDRPWTAGDNINLAVGQGDLQANPLQMAVAYSALANGGELVTPHLGKQVESVTGEVLEEIRPVPKRELDFSEETGDVIMEGLRRAAMEEGGTSYQVFGNFPFDVAGKTGTAERGFTTSGLPLPDQGWYVAMAPAREPRIVIAVTVERGGFGVDSAAPVAARMLERFFSIKPVAAISVPEEQVPSE
jgi:penicillin-binding protein 2